MRLKENWIDVIRAIGRDIKEIKGKATLYVLEETEAVSVSSHLKDERKVLQIKNGIGKIHVDFTYTNNNHDEVIFQLPNTAPVPENLIEVQTYDGGSIYVDRGARAVKGQQLKQGTRYIVDLLGFFN